MYDKWLLDDTKLLWHPDRLAAFIRGERVNPILIDAGIHKACNIHCKFCYGVKQIKSAGFIPEDRLLMLADDMLNAGIKAIAVIGDGEPTMNKGLYSFVQRLKSHGIDAAVATNGLMLNEDKIKILTSSLVWLRFNISAIGRYEEIMGAPLGSFERFEAIVKQAIKYRGDCTIGLQSVLIPEGFSDILPLAKKAVEWGVDYLVIKQFSDGGLGMPMHFDMDEYKKAKECLEAAQSLSTDKTAIIIKWQAMEDSTNITKKKKWGFKRCIDLPFLFQISGDGGCYPCGYFFGNKDFCYGNVCDQRLRDILKSDRYWAVIKKCADTPLEKLCTGQCRHCVSNKVLNKLVEGIPHQNFI